MKIRSAQELMRDNTLVKHRAGSHAYGTNIPTSDKDFRGIFCADPVNVRTPFFPVRESEDITEEDTKLYELAHFMKLCTDCNPNIIETLWVANDDVTFCTPAYEHLRAHRGRLLSSKIAHTTSGYAFAQLKRIKGHNKWINSPQAAESPQPKDFISVVQWFGVEKNLKVNFANYRKFHRLVPYGRDMYGVVPAPEYELFNPDTGQLYTNMDDVGRVEFNNELPLFIAKFNKDEYKLAKEKHTQYWEWKNNRNEVRSELEEEHGYDCYAAGTEFLTVTGWKRYDEIDDHELIATVNPETFKLEYQEIEDRFDGMANCRMRHLYGNHTDCLITPNHRMFVRHKERNSGKTGEWGFTQAALLPDTFEALRCITPTGRRYSVQEDFRNISIKDLAFLRLMGWYLSDGSASFNANSPKSIRISQKDGGRLHWHMSRFQTKYGDTANSSLYEYTKDHSLKEDKTITEIILDVRDTCIVAKIVNECGHGSFSKRIPRWVFGLSKRMMEILFDSMVLGDGTIREHKKETDSVIYYTSSEGLANDVQELAVHCGWETSLYGPYHHPSVLNDNPIGFQVHVRKNVSQFKTYIRNQNLAVFPKKSQRVVCFVVKNATLVTRRNGHISYHGNTKHAMHLVRLLRMGHEALRNGEIVVKRPDAQELLAIRNGAWTYEEILAYAEEMEHEVKEVWYKKTDLPKKPDVKFAAQLVMEIQDLVWGKVIKNKHQMVSNPSDY